MKTLKALLFSTVFFTGFYESFASPLPSAMEEILNSSSGRPTLFLRRVRNQVEPDVFARFQGAVSSIQSPPQHIEALRGVIKKLEEEAQRRLASVISSPAEKEEPAEGLRVSIAAPTVLHTLTESDSRSVLLTSSSSPNEDQRVSVRMKTHRDRKASLLEALQELPRRIRVGREALVPLVKEEETRTREIQDSYGAWGLALLRGEDTSSLRSDLDAAMQKIYGSSDPEVHEQARGEIKAILAGSSDDCHLPELFRKMSLLQFYRQSTEGKAPFFQTLGAEQVRQRFQIVADILPQIVNFNRVVFQGFDPEHLNFENITGIPQAVLRALTGNKDEFLRRFFGEDQFKERKAALQKENYSSVLGRLIDGLKAAASRLASARVQENLPEIVAAEKILKSAGLPADVLEMDEDDIKSAIHSLLDKGLADIALESFKEIGLPKIYESTMKSLRAQWQDYEIKREKYIVEGDITEGRVGADGLKEPNVRVDGMRKILAQNAERIGVLEQEIQDLEREEQRSREELSHLQEMLEREG